MVIDSGWLRAARGKIRGSRLEVSSKGQFMDSSGTAAYRGRLVYGEREKQCTE